MKQISLCEFFGSQRRKQEELMSLQTAELAVEEPEAAPSAEENQRQLEQDWFALGREAGIREGRNAARDEYELAISEQGKGAQGQIIEHLQSLRTALIREVARARRELEVPINEVLASLFKDRISIKAKSELVQTTRMLLNSNGVTAIAIKADAETVALLQSRLSDLELSISYVESESADAIISFDQTLIQTRIDEWKSQVDAILQSEGLTQP